MDTLEEVKLILKRIAISQEKRMVEFDERMVNSQKNFDERMAKFDERMSIFREESKISQRKTDEQIRKTSKEVQKISEDFSGFTHNQGAMIENLFHMSLKDDLVLDGIPYNDITLNLEIENTKINLQQEFDIILKNGSEIAIIEAKSTPKLKHLDQLENIIKNYKILFKEYKDHTIHGFLASLHKFNPYFKSQAHKRGIKLLNLKGNKVEITQ